jgi:hypothetical protein
MAAFAVLRTHLENYFKAQKGSNLDTWQLKPIP